MAERYSVFTEASSGVNPFRMVPYAPTYPLGPLIGALRTLPLLVSLALLLPLEYAVTALEGVALPLGAALRQGLCRPLARCVLWCLGLAAKLEEVRKEALALRPPAARSSGSGGGGSGGELLLVNSCSYLDALVLLGVWGAGMAELCSAGALRRVPLWRALLRAFREGGGGSSSGAAAAAPAPAPAPAPAAAPSGPCSVLRALGGSGGAALALQPEGAPTNGTALLSLSGQSQALGRLGAALPPAVGLRLLALHYSSTGDGGRFSPCFLRQAPPLWHAACLLTAPASACAALALPPGFDPLPSDFAPPAAWPAAIVGGWEQLLRRFGVRGVALGADTHARFLAVAAEGKAGKRA